MEFFILIGQRKESYPGEYAPEALAVIDGNGNEENPDYMREQLELHEKTGEFSRLAPIVVTVSQAKIDAILSPRPPEISGDVKPAVLG